MFLRKKMIKGHEYWYLVENKWVGGRSKQKVVKYLGSRGSFDMSEVVKAIERSKAAKNNPEKKIHANS